MGYQSKALAILHRLIPITGVLEKKIVSVILPYIITLQMMDVYSSIFSVTLNKHSLLLYLLRSHWLRLKVKQALESLNSQVGPPVLKVETC